MMHRTAIPIRDPFILPLPETRHYVMYGTTDPQPFGAGVGFDAYTSSDLEHWQGPFPVFRPPSGFWGTANFWAPEVHHYAGSYFMLATFTAPGRRRGTQVLRAERPLGPFLPLSEGPVTPADLECLDGTLYVENGVPWLVFCHEWLQAGDGRMLAVPLTPDLRQPAGPATALFSASSARWVRELSLESQGLPYRGHVTDGPFLFRRSGRLMMLWSSFSERGYAVGLAASENGVLGPWIQRDRPLYDEGGGHAMIFRSFEGRYLLALHRPNTPPDVRATFLDVPLDEIALA